MRFTHCPLWHPLYLQAVLDHLPLSHLIEADVAHDQLAKHLGRHQIVDADAELSRAFGDECHLSSTMPN